MQPEATNTSFGSEKPRTDVVPSADRMPILPAPEVSVQTGIEKTAERVEQVAEAQAAASDVSAPIAPTPVQPVVLDATTQDNATSSTSSAPAAASDDDIIEKEWVDHAKKIINETKDDPYKRELEVSKLQKDYLKKRYNKDVGLPPQEAW